MAKSVRQSKEQVQSKVRFLEDQLIALDHYLPETYEYLMAELDRQRLLLAEISVTEAFDQIDQNLSEQPEEEPDVEQTTKEDLHCPTH
jgi:hypothetical protein